LEPEKAILKLLNQLLDRIVRGEKWYCIPKRIGILDRHQLGQLLAERVWRDHANTKEMR